MTTQNAQKGLVYKRYYRNVVLSNSKSTLQSWLKSPIYLPRSGSPYHTWLSAPPQNQLWHDISQLLELKDKIHQTGSSSPPTITLPHHAISVTTLKPDDWNMFSIPSTIIIHPPMLAAHLNQHSGGEASARAVPPPSSHLAVNYSSHTTTS